VTSGEPGLRSPVVLILVKESRYGGAIDHIHRGRLNVFYVPGTAVKGDLSVVATAQHALTDGIRAVTEDSLGHTEVEAWAMPATDFYWYRETQSPQVELSAGELSAELVKRGAVRGHGFHSSVNCEQMVFRKYCYDVDFVLVKLDDELPLLDEEQPLTLSEDQAFYLADHLINAGPQVASIQIILQGFGDYFSVRVSGSYGGDRSRNMTVQWRRAVEGTWLHTGTKVAGPAAIQLAIRNAIDACEDGPIYGIVGIEDMFIPHGFSGGGVYMRVPAAALGPNHGADPNAPAGRPSLT
jgi:hypothetical protein